MTTNVPGIALTDTGYIAPTEAEILAGVWADLQAAFGGALTEDLQTPQGQLAMSWAAIVADKDAQLVALLNSVNPDFSTGRMQDGIGQIYFIDRIAATSTYVDAVCTGLTGTIIPAGSLAADQAGVVYRSLQDGTIGPAGTVGIPFSCVATGPIPCPTDYLTRIYKSVPGWDSVTNPDAGIMGRNVETATEFEYRRRQSVAKNSTGAVASVQGAVLAVDGVTDCYVLDNGLSTISGATFTGSISGVTLTVTAISAGEIKVGHMVTGSGVDQGTVITGLGSGTGGAGTYAVSISQSVASASMASSFGGVMLPAHSLYVAVVGGDSTAVAQAILRKKSPGCNYTGNTVVQIEDPDTDYQPPKPVYSVSFTRPDVVSVRFSVQLQRSSDTPSDAVSQVKAAIISAFYGADGGQRARIGSYIRASRFYAALQGLGSWVLVDQLLLGIGTADRQVLLLQIDQAPSTDESNISVVIL